MRTHATVDEALAFEGPGLADFVTAQELDQLIDGTLPISPIADRYLDHVASVDDFTVEQPAEEMREDLLGWIRSEIEANIWGRKQEARDAAMSAALKDLDAYEREYVRRKAELIEKARGLGATKAAIASTLDISRPTLDRLLNEQQARALFNDAIEYLTKPGTPIADYHEVITMWFGDGWIDRYNGLLGVRNVREQATAVNDLLTALEDLPLELPADRAATMQLANETAVALLGDRQ